jgi:hypothetical protein
MGAELIVTLPGHQETGQICSDCGKAVEFNEETWLLQVMIVHQHGGVPVLADAVDEESDDGDYLYEPHFFCTSCWNTMYEAHRRDIKDDLPVPDQHGSFECAACGSDIRSGELVGSAMLGEFLISNREPSGVRGPKFFSSKNPDILCLHCISLLNSELIEMWPGGVSLYGECQDCLQQRCWRVLEDGIQCGCSCHEDE